MTTALFAPGTRPLVVLQGLLRWFATGLLSNHSSLRPIASRARSIGTGSATIPVMASSSQQIAIKSAASNAHRTRAIGINDGKNSVQSGTAGLVCTQTAIARTRGPSAQPVLRVMRVMRVLEAGQAPASVGRMVISGRMADVCAELDRLAAREAELH